MRAIVTGVAGFIGSHVAEQLLSQGHQVLGLDNLSGGFPENIPAGADFRQVDVLDSLDDIFADYKPEVVYHLAAYAAEGLSHHIPRFNYMNNVVGTVNVLTAAHRARVRHFVFTSSIAVYGHATSASPFDESHYCQPCDPYGAAKLACEHHLRAFAEYYGGPSYTIFRPHNVFGPRQNIADPFRNVVGIFLRCVRQNRPLPIFGDGKQTRSFSYIDSVAACIAQAPNNPQAVNKVYNVGGDEPCSVLQLAELIAEVMNISLQVEWLPPRHEVLHAHCSHARVHQAFPSLFVDSIDIRNGLQRMAAFSNERPIPPATACPAPIEITEKLPPSWRAAGL